jgi:ArsR family transcriptional regulator
MEIVNQRLQRLVNTDICDAENVEQYRTELLHLADTLADSQTMKKRSQFFKALGEEKRLRILRLLQIRDMCLCELMIALEMTQPNLTHHLTILEIQNLVTRTKRGRWVYCSLDNTDLISHIFELNPSLSH